MSYNAGDAYMQVVPSFRGFVEKVKAEINRVGDANVRVVADTADARTRLDETRRTADALGRQSPTIKVKADTRDAQQQMHLLRDAIVFLGPVAIPVAGVLSGALLGVLPAAATLALGIKGISDEMKSGQLVGTQYGADLAALSAEGDKLKDIAAGGLLSGVDRALQTSGPLFKEVNTDVGIMSTQLGNIVAGAGPALVSIFTALNPLFTTFGNLLSSGAAKLEHWSTSSSGVESFVAYVQTELPEVEHLLGGVLTLVGHLLEGSAGSGDALLHDLNAIVGAIDAIPVGVLQTAIPLAISLYAALRTGAGVTAITKSVTKAVTGVGDALALTGPKAAAAAAAQSAASAEIEATTAAEAVAVARAKLAEAESQEAAARSAAQWGAAFDESATAVTAAAREEVAALESVAEAAAQTAATVRAEATATAATVDEEGAAASAGWTSMLGPLAAVGIGITLLTTLFGNDNQAAQENQKIMDGYAQSLKESANGLADVNIQQTAKNLQDSGAVKLMKELADNNVAVTASTRGVQGSTDGLRLSQAQLVLAVNGTQKQYDTLYDSLIKVADANKQDANSDSRVAAYNATGQAALSLAGKIKQLRGDMTAEMKIEAELTDIQKQSQIAIDGGTSAVAANARQYGVTSDAYLAAQKTVQKNIDTTKAQTLAFQLDNDAGSLLAQTLDKLSGKKLSYQQALNQFQSQLTSGGPKGTPGTPGTGNEAAVASATSRHAIAVEALAIAQSKYNTAVAKGQPTAAAQLALDRAKAAVDNSNRALSAAQKSGGGTPGVAADTRLTGLSGAAVQNRSDILALVQAAEQTAEAYGKMTGSSEESRQKLIALRTQLINSRVALGENRAEVTKYVDSLLTIPAKVPPTKLDVTTDAAKAKVDAIQARINRIKQGKEPHLDANSFEARGVIAELQAEIDKLHGKTVVLSTVVSAQTKANLQSVYNEQVPGFHLAHGGVLDFFANGGVRESHVAQIAPAGAMRLWAEPETGGEAYIPLAPSKRARSRLIAQEAVTRLGGIASFLDGGFSRVDLSNVGTSRGIRDVTVHQDIHSPLPETASVLGPRGMEQAAYALDDTA